MQLLNLTLDTPEQDLALDEALLEAHTADPSRPGVLRFWELASPAVVVGRGSRIAQEVRLEECRREGVPVLRRVSGGLSIVAGPGCLMYTVVARDPSGKGNIDAVHAQVLDVMLGGLRQAGLAAQRAGTSDLAIDNGDMALRKVSGNSLRITRGAYLYHGTLLYDFELPLIPRLLKEPPRAPDYRGDREHRSFVANLPTSRETLMSAIAAAWDAGENLEEWPKARVAQLVGERYGRDEWNQSR